MSAAGWWAVSEILLLVPAGSVPDRKAVTTGPEGGGAVASRLAADFADRLSGPGSGGAGPKGSKSGTGKSVGTVGGRVAGRLVFPAPGLRRPAAAGLGGSHQSLEIKSNIYSQKLSKT